MADCGQVSGKNMNINFPKNCGSCLGNQRKREAKKFCHVCKTYFCDQCMRQHNGLFSNHRITDTGPPDSEALDQCPDHGLLIDLYCKDDDTPGCTTCISSKHGSCKEVVYLPILAKKVIQDTDVEGIRREIQEFIQRLDSTKVTQQTTIADIEENRETCLQKISDHHKLLLRIINRFVKSSKNDVQQVFERLRGELHSDQDDIEKCLAELKTKDEQLKQDNDVHLFLDLHSNTHQKVMESADDVLIKSLNNLAVHGFDVSIDQRLKNLLSELQSFANVTLRKSCGQEENTCREVFAEERNCRPRKRKTLKGVRGQLEGTRRETPVRDNQKCQSLAITAQIGSADRVVTTRQSAPVSDNGHIPRSKATSNKSTGPTETEHRVSVSKTEGKHSMHNLQVDISIEQDEENTSVSGACVLSDGSVVLADWNNKMLKLLEQPAMTITDHCPMPVYPIDVCCINMDSVAVTLSNCKVALVSVNRHLFIKRIIAVNHYCAYLTHSQGELFISDGGKTLYVHDIEGKPLRKIATDISGQDIFSTIHHIVSSDDGNKLYVANAENSLITLDRQGKVLDKLFNAKISNTHAVCLDGLGGLFIAGHTSHNVVHMGPDGRILAEVLTKSQGLISPLAVCYDRSLKRLFVSQGNNQLLVCEVEC